jgi:hypothetical protein
MWHIEKVEPKRYLAFRWANRFPPQQPRQGNSTLVEYTPIPEAAGAKTRLRVVESAARAGLPGGRACSGSGRRHPVGVTAGPYPGTGRTFGSPRRRTPSGGPRPTFCT